MTIKIFIENNNVFNKLLTFIYSLPLYPISIDFEDTTLV